ncbi:uncharacterized protein TNCV_3646311 [Trichonephila clavipes]|nr:uncharacterized protein TNCV_3646311 [Trichonephila clavipes]
MEDQALSIKCVYERSAHFREGRESVSDNLLSVKPAVSDTDEIIEKVRKLIAKECRLTVCVITDEMQISRETVLENVTQNLEMRKTYCRLVPHHLTYNQKQARSEGSQNFVETADVTPNFLNCIVTEDESWCLRYEHETRKTRTKTCSPVTLSPLL